MKILVINTGSSSIKYQLFEIGEKISVIAVGLVEKIGEKGSVLVQKQGDQLEKKLKKEKGIGTHKDGLQLALSLLTDAKHGVIQQTQEIDGVGHRVVHGGESFQTARRIDEKVLEAIEGNIPLAPLHNPPNILGIKVAMSLFADVPHVAVFDTAFHQTLPPHAFLYAVPYSLYEEQHVRRYGFHGTSHHYVAKQTAVRMQKPLATLNLITLHLGNGASVTAIRGGKSIDTSMGMTPLEGLIMGTRSGDIDPALHFYLMDHVGMNSTEVNALLNKQSGLKGIASTNDMRELIEKHQQGDRQATLAIAMYTYRLRKYIGAYFAILGTVDALVFTGGIGENSLMIRQEVCQGLEGLGMVIDTEQNQNSSKNSFSIHAKTSQVQIFVIPTNEELEIAQETYHLLTQSDQTK